MNNLPAVRKRLSADQTGCGGVLTGGEEDVGFLKISYSRDAISLVLMKEWKLEI